MPRAPQGNPRACMGSANLTRVPAPDGAISPSQRSRKSFWQPAGRAAEPCCHCRFPPSSLRPLPARQAGLVPQGGSATLSGSSAALPLTLHRPRCRRRRLRRRRSLPQPYLSRPRFPQPSCPCHGARWRLGVSTGVQRHLRAVSRGAAAERRRHDGCGCGARRGI